MESLRSWLNQTTKTPTAPGDSKKAAGKGDSETDDFARKYGQPEAQILNGGNKIYIKNDTFKSTKGQLVCKVLTVLAEKRQPLEENIRWAVRAITGTTPPKMGFDAIRLSAEEKYVRDETLEGIHPAY